MWAGGRRAVGLAQFAPLLHGFGCCHALSENSRDQFVIRGATSCEANIAVTTLCLANNRVCDSENRWLIVLSAHIGRLRQ